MKIHFKDFLKLKESFLDEKQAGSLADLFEGFAKEIASHLEALFKKEKDQLSLEIKKKEKDLGDKITDLSRSSSSLEERLGFLKSEIESLKAQRRSGANL